MAAKKGSIIPGVLLVTIGLWIFSRNLRYSHDLAFQVYPILLMVFALFLFIETYRRHNSNALFWGIVIFVVGGFYLLRNYDLIPYFYIEEYWPIFLVALGLGFVGLFAFNPKDWGVLIPACIFLFFGAGFSLNSLHSFPWRWERYLENYWPVILIIIGLGIFLNGFTKRQQVKAKADQE